MEVVLFTLTGIMIYLVSDRILVEIERYKGKVFAGLQRQMVFFIIFLPLILIAFEIMKKMR